MLSKTEIDQAIIAVAATKSPQSTIIRRHAGAIVEAMAAGAPMKEILSALREMTGVKIDQRWAYRILESDRKKAKAAPVTMPAKPNPSAPRVSVMAPASGVPAPMKGSPSAPTPAAAQGPAATASPAVTTAQPTPEQLITMLPPRHRNGQVEINHPLPDKLPPGVNIALLQRVMKMDGFNPSWPRDIRLNLILALPDVLPDHLNPIAEIGGERCDLRLGMPAKFGSSSDGMGVKRGDDRWDKILGDEKLRKKWRSAHEDIRRAYNDWLKGQIGLPVR